MHLRYATSKASSGSLKTLLWCLDHSLQHFHCCAFGLQCQSFTDLALQYFRQSSLGSFSAQRGFRCFKQSNGPLWCIFGTFPQLWVWLGFNKELHTSDERCTFAQLKPPAANVALKYGCLGLCIRNNSSPISTFWLWHWGQCSFPLSNSGEWRAWKFGVPRAQHAQSRQNAVRLSKAGALTKPCQPPMHGGHLYQQRSW